MCVPFSNFSYILSFQNVNEFSPVLSIPSSVLSVVETRPVGSVLTQISATDQDNVIGNLVSGYTSNINPYYADKK